MSDWLSRFSGRWRVQRRTSNGFVFAGPVYFVLSDDRMTLGYHEQVKTQPPSIPLTASKRYHITLNPERQLHITHDDNHNRGEAFQTVPLFWDGRQFTGDAQNLCLRDHYTSRYLLGRNRLQIHHQVNGPKKDYEIFSTYVRSP